MYRKLSIWNWLGKWYSHRFEQRTLSFSSLCEIDVQRIVSDCDRRESHGSRQKVGDFDLINPCAGFLFEMHAGQCARESFMDGIGCCFQSSFSQRGLRFAFVVYEAVLQQCLSDLSLDSIE